MSNENNCFSDHAVLQVLAAALTRTVQSYDEFCSRLVPESAKEFIAHHNACKAALAHLSSLIRLIRLQDKIPEKGNGNLESLLLQARNILLKTEGNP